MMIGDKYGRLTITKLISRTPKTGAIVACRCDCGKEKITRVYYLRSGGTQSCGCLNRELTSARSTKRHEARRAAGTVMYNRSEYTVYMNMLQRCRYPKATNFHRYGGRGIDVCQRWKDSFKAFLEDVGPRPSLRHTLDRKNNDLGYYRDNCKWVEKLDQANNTACNVWLEFDGQRHTIAEWGRVTGIRASAIRSRLRAKWPLASVLTVPVSRFNKTLKLAGAAA